MGSPNTIPGRLSSQAKLRRSWLTVYLTNLKHKKQRERDDVHKPHSGYDAKRARGGSYTNPGHAQSTWPVFLPH